VAKTLICPASAVAIDSTSADAPTVIYHTGDGLLMPSVARAGLTDFSTTVAVAVANPITAVRNKLIDAALRQTPYKSDAQAVLIFKAWNAIRRGKSMQRPRYTIGETIETAV